MSVYSCTDMLPPVVHVTVWQTSSSTNTVYLLFQHMYLHYVAHTLTYLWIYDALKLLPKCTLRSKPMPWLSWSPVAICRAYKPGEPPTKWHFQQCNMWVQCRCDFNNEMTDNKYKSCLFEVIRSGVQENTMYINHVICGSRFLCTYVIKFKLPHTNMHVHDHLFRHLAVATVLLVM